MVTTTSNSNPLRVSRLNALRRNSSLSSSRVQRRNIWSPLEIQGVESFESGSAILRARFKTAPIKQWEVSRAFNMSLKRHLDEAGLDLATPRLSVQVVTAGSGTLQKE